MGANTCDVCGEQLTGGPSYGWLGGWYCRTHFAALVRAEAKRSCGGEVEESGVKLGGVAMFVCARGCKECG